MVHEYICAAPGAIIASSPSSRLEMHTLATPQRCFRCGGLKGRGGPGPMARDRAGSARLDRAGESGGDDGC